jgi:5-methylcytosine-specific restriction endonuclease McrA
MEYSLLMRDAKGRFIKGYKPVWSDESRRKVSESTKGLNTWSKGRKLTEEHKLKVRQNSARYWLGKKRPSMTGMKNHNWKLVKKSPLYQAVRESTKYKLWRLDILKRDNFICVLCGDNKKLEADHYPKRFIDIFNESNVKTFDEAMEHENLWKLSHARTLCRKCHRETPTWGKRYLTILK